jgi:5-(carboxyamino)imidazole ribonucleotide synthase
VRVGIVGGGQLGMMLVEAGRGLGVDCVTLDPSEDSPASRAGPSIVGAYDDPAALERLADGVDVITYEFENVPVEGVRALTDRAPVLPPPQALEAAQDRLAEKTLFTEVGLAVPPFVPVDDLPGLRSATGEIGLPAVLKTRRFGYDGKGQAVLRHEELAADAWRAVGEVPSILERLVPFDRELSVVAARGRDGEVRCWPLVENHHRDGILRLSIAPAPALTAELQDAAETHAHAVLERLDYAGVLAIELFQVGSDLLGNEMAPRVHNSGHWTIEGSITSQFENHLRAICGMPLGDVSMRGAAAMVNLIGEEPALEPIRAIPGAHVHRYGKEPRPGRKLGHVTFTAEDERLLRERIANIPGISVD